MRRMLAVLAVLAITAAGRSAPAAASAAPADSLFAAGSAAYEAGAYADAVEIYTQVAALGIVNADLYYNLANAYFKSGELGRSVLWYERSLRLEPRNPDARATGPTRPSVPHMTATAAPTILPSPSSATKQPHGSMSQR